VYYNGTLKEENVFNTVQGVVPQPVKISIVMAGGIGTTPMKIGSFKVWNQELDSGAIMKNYELGKTMNVNQ